MNRQGFTLIEVLIALAITGFMATVLFTALFQINNSVNVSESIMTVNEKAARLQQLFERDLSGATTLLDNNPPKPKDTDKDLKQTSTSDKQGQEKKEEQKSEKKEKHIIKKIFNGSGKSLTFISNNPLLGFWATKTGSFEAGKAKPFLVRITYQLEEDPKSPGSLILKRQESVPLDFEKRSGRSYEVLDGIKSLSFKYTSKTVKTVETQEQKTDPAKSGAQSTNKNQSNQPAQKPQKPKTEITYVSGLTTWDSDEKIESESKKEEPKEKRLPIPVFVDIEAVLWDSAQQRDFKYDFTLEIIPDTQFTQKMSKWSFMSFFQKQQEKTDGNKTPQPTVPKNPQGTFNVPYKPSPGLQKQLEGLFKTAHSLDLKRST